jgi:hypothetical protein
MGFPQVRAPSASLPAAGVLAVRVLAAGVLAAGSAAALTAGSQAPALADQAVVASQCQRLPGLTAAQLCVSVQGTVASVRPGGMASYAVSVWVSGGFAASVTVALSAQPSGEQPAYVSGCPVGNGTASCWIPDLALLGAPSGFQMQAQVPAASRVTSVTLTATASAVALGSWTPPAAAASVPVSAPSPAPSHSPSPAPSKRATSSPGRSPSPASSSAPGSADPAGAPGGPGGPGAGAGPGLDPGAALPLAALPAFSGKAPSITAAGNASGLFPTISPTGAPGTQFSEKLQAAPAATGLKLAPTAVVLGLVAVALGLALAMRDLHRRKGLPGG